MKISWNYLQSLFADKLDKAHVLERLTMAGLEVESESSVAPAFSGIVVGEVIECERHPGADKLSLCKIDAGTGELLQIICGAPNVAVGVKAPCAKVGAVLPENFKIAERKMRGLVSYGMMCGGDEIGCPDGVDGLLLLPKDAPVGADIREYLDLDDMIVEFKITPNRGDCLSYLGLAREVAALTDYQLKPKCDVEDYLSTPAVGLKLDVSATLECPHYVGLAINNVVNNFATPTWLVRLLERSGIRSISPIVDITNYVMLTLGQPMHAFDATKLHSGIGVRMANNGEQIKLLDGKEVSLKDNTLVITNAANQAVAIAGVMGGFDSGVIDATTSIVLESAFFAPDIIQGKTKQYGVNSDSAFRFERGVDSGLQHQAINLATKLVLEICGGTVGEFIHFANLETNQEKIELTFTEINRFVGIDIPSNQMIDILTKLGCQVAVDGDRLVINPPSYRFDLKIKADIIEEIIRVYGYDRIEAKMPHLDYSLDYLDKSLAKTMNLKNIMLGYGFNEVVNYAFIEDKYSELFTNKTITPVKLQNPIAGLNVMRTNLLSGLIKTLQSNVNRGYESVRIFEMARIFNSERNDAQPIYLSGLMYGKISPLSWSETPRSVDFYDLRLVVEELLAYYGDIVLDNKDIADIYHPGRAAHILLNGIRVGCIGQLHPSYEQKLGLAVLPYVFEINVELLTKTNDLVLQMPSKYQKVSRDLAFVLQNEQAVGEILDAIKRLKIVELFDLSVFDIFRGGNLAANEKSVAINLIFQAERTLNEDEITTKLNEIKLMIADKFAAKLR